MKTNKNSNTKKKNKLDFRSIKFNVWTSCLILTCLILGIMWFMQIFFLNNYYEKMKVTETEEAVSTISNSYKYDDNETFLSVLSKQIDESDISVKVVKNEDTIYSSVSDDAFTGEFSKIKNSLHNASPDQSSVALILKGEKTQRETWAYAGYLDASHSTVLYVLSPLYPVISTTTILKNQFAYSAFVSFILAAILAAITSALISKPINDLNEYAKELSNGEYGITFPTNYSYSEINELSDTLNKASAELEKSVNLQKDLMANVSHDLKTPLTMVKSYAEMIRDLSGDIPEKRNAHLQVIIDESDRLNKLVNDILTLSAVQAGTLELNVQKFSIKDLVSTLLQPYELLEQNEGYHIVFNCRQDVEVIGDPERIKQVVSNLLTNAIKYCGSDKEIYINIKHWGKRVHCEIVDHGQGIKADELPYVWERYYKSSTNHVRATKGSGIGLSIVKEILLAHNARFGVESKVGKGTTFWFELEVVPEEKKVKRSKHLLHR